GARARAVVEVLERVVLAALGRGPPGGGRHRAGGAGLLGGLADGGDRARARRGQRHRGRGALLGLGAGLDRLGAGAPEAARALLAQRLVLVLGRDVLGALGGHRVAAV